jgi:hypothetical protein
MPKVYLQYPNARILNRHYSEHKSCQLLFISTFIKREAAGDPIAVQIDEYRTSHTCNRHRFPG